MHIEMNTTADNQCTASHGSYNNDSQFILHLTIPTLMLPYNISTKFHISKPASRPKNITRVHSILKTDKTLFSYYTTYVSALSSMLYRVNNVILNEPSSGEYMKRLRIGPVISRCHALKWFCLKIIGHQDCFCWDSISLTEAHSI